MLWVGFKIQHSKFKIMRLQKINPLFPALKSVVEKLTKEFGNIPIERKEVLNTLTTFIQQKKDVGQPVYLNFICTHNSRRSHISQLWAQAAAHYYNVDNVHCFSGGTEATAFNPRAVKAMKDVGFQIAVAKEGGNPIYEVKYAEDAATVTVFSKKYDDPYNHNKDFAAIMTCSHADENCPVVVGASARLPIRYNDPKEFDDTPLESVKYAERVQEIGREMLYIFSEVRI
jgi:arsenate reductase (thioredoxin)